MTEQKNKTLRDRAATWLGLVVAIATGLITIDFKTFDIYTEWPKLLCVVAIAVGGYQSEMKKIK